MPHCSFLLLPSLPSKRGAGIYASLFVGLTESCGWNTSWAIRLTGLLNRLAGWGWVFIVVVIRTLIKAIGIVAGGEAPFGHCFFHFRAHFVRILLREEGASIVGVVKTVGAATGHAPGPRKNLEPVNALIGFIFFLEWPKSVHQGNGDIGKYRGPAGRDLISGEGGDEAGEKDSDIRDGAEFLEIADQSGRGIFLGLMAEAIWGLSGRAEGAAAATRGTGMGAAWKIGVGDCGIAFHFGPLFWREFGGTRVIFGKSA
jgi:hypothetical protein